MTRRLRNWRRRAVRQINKRAGVYRQKVFCVGRNKTGTTTMQTVLTDYGFRMGPQREAERFVHDHQRDMQPSFWDWVDAHEAFQDVPFSTTWLLPELYARYPDALYILTVRDPDDWFESLTKFHARISGLQNDAERAELARGLRDSTYIAPGYRYAGTIRQYGITSDDQLYDRDLYIRNYEDHNALVRRTIPAGQLLEIDIGNHSDTSAVCRFLGMPAPSLMKRPMPWMNRRS
jgi:hypothetical protein